MSRIYSAFSNPSGDLVHLKKEFSGLFNFFNEAEIKKRVDYGFTLNERVDEITSDIVKGQGEIRLFHFSGHSGGSGLNFDGSDFDAGHVSTFFNTISADRSRIECVLLNGCENAAIVEQLSTVPVVIGTRTPIQDSAAQKFTRDFFSALIGAGSTYRQAFRDAAAAQKNLQVTVTDRLRGEGGTEEASTPLNHYFLVINDREVADRSFPFKRAPHNWTKFMLVFFIVIAGLLAWMFSGDIAMLIKGYTCSPITTDKDKCNFVITEFSGDHTFSNFEDFLYRKVKRSEILQHYLHAINLGSFDRVIRGAAVDEDKLPELCGYDFNLTGNLTRRGDSYDAELDIYPLHEKIQPLKPFIYSVQSINQIDSLTTLLDTGQANQFVLFEMCAICALQKGKPEIKHIMQEMLADFTVNPASAVSYQRMQYRMAEVALDVADTTLAIKSYEKITTAAPNDFALSAHERLIGLLKGKGDVKGLYTAQTRYLDALEVRKTQPSRYQLSKEPKAYERASDNVRLQRADLGLKYRDAELKEQRTEVIKDYERLDKEKHNNRSYKDQIGTLKGAALGFNPALENTTLHSATLHTLSPALHTATPLTHLATVRKTPVAVSGYGVTIVDLRKLIGMLEDGGYAPDASQTRILERLPQGSTQSTVYFDKAEHREVAIQLARQLTEWTRTPFQVQQRQALAIHQLQATEQLRVFWKK